MRLFVNTQNQGVLGRVEIDADHVSRLGTELRVGADAPTTSPLQLYLVLAKDPPHMVVADVAQRFRQQASVPLRVAIGRFLIEQHQYALFRGAVVARGLAGPRSVRKRAYPLPHETLPPFRHARRTGM